MYKIKSRTISLTKQYTKIKMDQTFKQYKNLLKLEIVKTLEDITIGNDCKQKPKCARNNTKSQLSGIMSN